MLYNILVLFLFLLMIFFSTSSKQTPSLKMFYLIICIITLGTISGFRYTPYGDFYNNLIGFTKAKYISWKEVISFDEPGHQFLRKFITLYSDNPQWYFAITSLFIVISFIVFIYRYSPNIYQSVFLFVTLGSYFTAHNITRQYIAISICLYAIPFLLNRKFIKFMIVVVVAMSFHTAAIVFLPLYFLAEVKVTKRLVFIYVISMIFFQLFFIQILTIVQNFIFSGYSYESYGLTNSSLTNIILPTIILILNLAGMRYRKGLNISFSVKVGDNYNRLNNLITQMGLIAFICSSLSVTKVLMMSRIAEFFTISYLILIPLTIASLSKKKQIILNGIILIIVFAYFFINNIAGRLSPTPYTPFWWY